MNHDQKKHAVATFMIPLQVSISFGAPVMAEHAPPRVKTPDRAPHRSVTPEDAAAVAEAVEQFSVSSLAETGFTWRAALSLALASKLAYASAAEVEATATSDWGLSTCEFVEAGDTQCFVAATADVVLVSFRGTESTGDWLADLNMRSFVRPYGAVHRGFYHAFRDVQPALEGVLAGFGAKPLVLTGHSLGGALATVAAAEWRGARSIRSIYTYGQPRCGNNTFRAFMNQHYGDTFIRFVNDDDIVTRVPPGFKHVGRLYHFDPDGNLQDATEAIAPASEQTEAPPLTQAQFDRLRAELLAQRGLEGPAALEGIESDPLASPELEGFFPSFRDHKLEGYIRKILQHV